MKWKREKGKGIRCVLLSFLKHNIMKQTLLFLGFFLSTLGSYSQCFSNLSSGNYFNLGIKPRLLANDRSGLTFRPFDCAQGRLSSE